MKMTAAEARARFEADRAHWAEQGVIALDSAQSYVPTGFDHNFKMALDAQPALVSTPNSGIPSFLTTIVDPQVYEVVVTPTKAAEILGEVKKGDWTATNAMFPMVERTGEVSAYGDYNENGMSGVNISFPQRESFLFQTITKYGDLELDRAGEARINLVTSLDRAAALVLNKFLDLSYHYGVAGKQCYGLLNDPGVSANGTLTPSVKSAGGTRWSNATANEIYNDILALFGQLVAQSGGTVTAEDKLVLALPPVSMGAMKATNQFGINVAQLIKDNFPNLEVVTSVRYATPGGNVVQLIAKSIEGQDSGYCAFNEKMRAHPVVRMTSSFVQKKTGGTWGAVIRMGFAFAQMIGV